MYDEIDIASQFRPWRPSYRFNPASSVNYVSDIGRDDIIPLGLINRLPYKYRSNPITSVNYVSDIARDDIAPQVRANRLPYKFRLFSNSNQPIEANVTVGLISIAYGIMPIAYTPTPPHPSPYDEPNARPHKTVFNRFNKQQLVSYGQEHSPFVAPTTDEPLALPRISRFKPLNNLFKPSGADDQPFVAPPSDETLDPFIRKFKPLTYNNKYVGDEQPPFVTPLLEEFSHVVKANVFPPFTKQLGVGRPDDLIYQFNDEAHNLNSFIIKFSKFNTLCATLNGVESTPFVGVPTSDASDSVPQVLKFNKFILKHKFLGNDPSGPIIVQTDESESLPRILKFKSLQQWNQLIGNDQSPFTSTVDDFGTSGPFFRFNKLKQWVNLNPGEQTPFIPLVMYEVDALPKIFINRFRRFVSSLEKSGLDLQPFVAPIVDETIGGPLVNRFKQFFPIINGGGLAEQPFVSVLEDIAGLFRYPKFKPLVLSYDKIGNDQTPFSLPPEETANRPYHLKFKQLLSSLRKIGDSQEPFVAPTFDEPIYGPLSIRFKPLLVPFNRIGNAQEPPVLIADDFFGLPLVNRFKKPLVINKFIGDEQHIIVVSTIEDNATGINVIKFPQLVKIFNKVGNLQDLFVAPTMDETQSYPTVSKFLKFVSIINKIGNDQQTLVSVSIDDTTGLPIVRKFPGLLRQVPFVGNDQQLFVSVKFDEAESNPRVIAFRKFLRAINFVGREEQAFVAPTTDEINVLLPNKFKLFVPVINKQEREDLAFVSPSIDDFTSLVRALKFPRFITGHFGNYITEDQMPSALRIVLSGYVLNPEILPLTILLLDSINRKR